MNKYNLNVIRKAGKITSAVALAATLSAGLPAIAMADEPISSDITSTSVEDSYSYNNTYGTMEDAEKAQDEQIKDLTESGYENIESTITEVAGTPDKGSSSETFDTKEEAEAGKSNIESDLAGKGYENIESTITEVAGTPDKGSSSETFDTKEEAEAGKSNIESDLAGKGYENIESTITEVAGTPEEKDFSGTYNTKEDAEKALNDFAEANNGEVTSSTVTENSHLNETLYEEGSSTFSNDANFKSYEEELEYKKELLGDDYRLEISEESTLIERVYTVVSSSTSGVISFATEAEAKAYIESLGESSDYKVIETKLTSKEVLSETVESPISETFDTKYDAEAYIEQLKAMGYDVSELEMTLKEFSESTWKDEDGVEIDPGTSDGKSFSYGHLDIRLVDSITKIDADGNSTTIECDKNTLTVSSVKINNNSIKMNSLSKDENDGNWEYKSTERNNLKVTNKSLVEITGTVNYGGVQLPFTVIGYLSESQNVCQGRGDAKGFDLIFKSVKIVNNKVYVDSNIVTQYLVSGTAKKETYETQYDVEYTVTNYEDKTEYVEGTKVSYKIYKQDYTYDYTVNGKVSVPTKDYVLDTTYEIPTKDYVVDTTYEIPTKDYVLDTTYDIPTKEYMLTVTADKKVDELVPEEVVTPNEEMPKAKETKVGALPQTGDNTSMVVPAGAALVALGGLAVAGRKRKVYSKK